jgi:hypothetical protein
MDVGELFMGMITEPGEQLGCTGASSATAGQILE